MAIEEFLGRTNTEAIRTDSSLIIDIPTENMISLATESVESQVLNKK